MFSVSCGRGRVERRRWRRQLLAATIAGVLATTAPVYANADPTGQMRGHIRSVDGNAIVGAAIVIEHESKGFQRRIVVDANGEYILKSLPVGRYTVTVQADGYLPLQQTQVDIQIGSSANLDAVLNEVAAERVAVNGARLARIVHTDSSSGLVISSSQLEKLPVSQDITGVSLLAPGTALGDSDFGTLASIAGASVAENGYYLNGFNITDLRRGMGWVAFPWESVAQTQVITGGVSAQYGRFIGGVSNLVSKSGSNDWHASANFKYEPDALAEQAQSLNWFNSEGEYDLVINNQENYSDWKELNLSFSGPIVEDKAFFYLLYVPSVYKSRSADGSALHDTTLYSSRRERDQVFANFDWYLFDDHSLNFMHLSGDTDNRNRDYRFNVRDGRIKLNGTSRPTRDVELNSISYHGQLTDSLSVSATYGEVEEEAIVADGTRDRNPVYDARSGTTVKFGDWVGESDDTNGDKREVFRIDFEWEFDDHSLRFGYDREELNSWRRFGFHGPNPAHNELYLYRVAPADADLSIFGDNGVFIIPRGVDYVRGRDFSVSADIKGESYAYYVEDRWQFNDVLSLSFGLRNEVFANYTGTGDKYIEVDDQWAPRFSAIWDVFGNGNHKAFFNYGRFYQPVAQNTGVRMTAQEWNVYSYYAVDSYDDQGFAVLGAPYGRITYANGQLRDARTYASDDLEPMYEDEISLGYEYVWQDNWVFGVRLVDRELKSSIEDAQVSHGIMSWCADTGRDCSGYESIANSSIWNGGLARIFNPGHDLVAWEDLDGDGTIERFRVPASYLGYPDMERTYRALELSARGDVMEGLTMQTSYTYSKSEGNTEGLLRTDNDQMDPGWTRSFDSPALTDHAYGYLPNDHRHNFKIWGTYQLSQDWILGFRYTALSGRPINAFGYHPLDQGACVSIDTTCGDAWANENFYVNGQPSPRGSHGRTDWIHNVDLSLNYSVALAGGELSAGLDIFNLFNFDHATQVNEYYEINGDPDAAERNPLWRQPSDWQRPRYVALSVRYEF